MSSKKRGVQFPNLIAAMYKHKPLCWLKLILLIIFTATAGIPADGQDRWFRAVHYDGAVDNAPVTLEFIGVRKEQQLAGEVLVANNIIPGQQSRPFVIEGRVADDGRFWLRGQIQVGDDRKGNGKPSRRLLRLDHLEL